MKKFFLPGILLLSFIIINSCANKGKSGLQPELSAADSAAVIFYDTANNPRFFKYTKVKDLKLLSAIIDDANSKIIEDKNACATQGKIYFYGRGDAVSVIYFSDLDECTTFSFIINGEKYFTSMRSRNKELLMELRKKAVVPGSKQ